MIRAIFSKKRASLTAISFYDYVFLSIVFDYLSLFVIVEVEVNAGFMFLEAFAVEPVVHRNLGAMGFIKINFIFRARHIH